MLSFHKDSRRRDGQDAVFEDLANEATNRQASITIRDAANRLATSPAPRGLLSERSHPNAAGLDDGEVTSPIVARSYEVGEPLSDIVRFWHGHA